MTCLVGFKIGTFEVKYFLNSLRGTDPLFPPPRNYTTGKFIAATNADFTAEMSLYVHAKAVPIYFINSALSVAET